MTSDAKRLAASAALELVHDGMCLGLGSGSTASIFIELLGQALRDARFRDLVGIPTSTQSDTLARAGGVPVVDFDTHARCDLTIDGADEIDPQLNLIKGLGGALLREKVVAQNSDRLVIIADESKLVTRLGTKAPVPVEVTTFGLSASERFLRSVGSTPALRQASGKPFVTDNGNLILDCRFDGIDDPASLARRLEERSGIVQHGMFLGLAAGAIVAMKDGSIRKLGS
jgi:ribose 5-phosphate isomerase A